MAHARELSLALCSVAAWEQVRRELGSLGVGCQVGRGAAACVVEGIAVERRQDTLPRFVGKAVRLNRKGERMARLIVPFGGRRIVSVALMNVVSHIRPRRCSRTDRNPALSRPRPALPHS
jgi:hypothetical protein